MTGTDSGTAGADSGTAAPGDAASADGGLVTTAPEARRTLTGSCSAAQVGAPGAPAAIFVGIVGLAGQWARAGRPDRW